MNKLVEAFVPGIARTKGSLTPKRIQGRTPVLVDSELSIAWRRLVAYQARNALPEGHVPSLAPIMVSIVVTLPGLDWKDVLSQGSGDIDKIVRNVLDALAVDPKKPDLAAGVYVNDAQVVCVNATKQPDRAGTLRRGLHLIAWENVDA